MMNMKIKFSGRRASLPVLIFAAIVAIGSLLGSPARADKGDPPDVEAQRLAHLLSYVGSDYGDAVEDGAIASQAEYDEQRSLLREAAAIAARLDDAPKPRPIDSKLTELVAAVAKAVEAKADAASVGASATKARNAALAAFGVSEVPKELPNPLRGKDL